MTGDRAEGWTLTEILVLVAVIGLIASIAIPIALRARRSDSDPATVAIRAVRAVPQDYNGSPRRPVRSRTEGATAGAAGSVKLASRAIASSLR
jgi:hypothetical protein